MLARSIQILFLFMAWTIASGCQATRTVGKKVGVAVVLTTCFLGNALINGLLDSDETILEKEARQKRERAWKQHWRDHPNDVPAMTERYKDDYV